MDFSTCRRMLGAGLLVGALVGCSSQAGKPVTATAAWQSDHCGYDQAQIKIFEEQEAWSEWVNEGLERQVSDRPWSGNIRVVVAGGTQPTPGYDIDFVRVLLEGDELVLHVDQGRPSRSAMVAQMITNPCLIVEVPSDEWQSVKVIGLSGEPLEAER